MKDLILKIASVPIAIYYVAKNGFNFERTKTELESKIENQRRRFAAAKYDRLTIVYKAVKDNCTWFRGTPEDHCAHPNGRPYCEQYCCPIMKKFMGEAVQILEKIC